MQKLNVHPMDELKVQLRQILNVVPQGSKIYYLDYPVHSNGGDLLIMKGTEAFFKHYNIRVQARYSILDFPEQLVIPKDCIIVLHGGGNFGDLYPQHQQLREKVIMNYPNHRIVILPQTIFYNKETEFERTAHIFSTHKDVHLYVRDTLSFQLAQSFQHCHVYLCPDMAHELWPIKVPRSPHKELLYFFRTDIEKTKAQEQLEKTGNGDYLDWTSLYSRAEKKSINMIVRLMRGRKAPSAMQVIWGRYTDYLVNKAVRRFSGYHTVQTSRLHGHILSCLMDKPNTLLDNSYGKNSNYYQTWTRGIQSAQLVMKHEEQPNQTNITQIS